MSLYVYFRVGGIFLFCLFWVKGNEIFGELKGIGFCVGGVEGDWIFWVRVCFGFEVSLGLGLWEK